MGGFELLDLHDFQDRARRWSACWILLGKQRICYGERIQSLLQAHGSVGAIRKTSVYTDESLKADLEVAHFGPAPLENAITKWKLVNANGKAVSQGELAPRTIPIDNGIKLGSVNLDLKA